jgi:hypothetical protein
MGTILAFSPRKSPRAKAAADRVPATVIIFPGVRYERLGASGGEAAKWPAVDWRVWQKPNPLPAT